MPKDPVIEETIKKAIISRYAKIDDLDENYSATSAEVLNKLTLAINDTKKKLEVKGISDSRKKELRAEINKYEQDLKVQSAKTTINIDSKSLIEATTTEFLHGEMAALDKAHNAGLIEINENGIIVRKIGKEPLTAKQFKTSANISSIAGLPMDHCAMCTYYLKTLGLPLGRPTLSASDTAVRDLANVQYGIPDFIKYNPQVLRNIMGFLDDKTFLEFLKKRVPAPKAGRRDKTKKQNEDDQLSEFNHLETKLNPKLKTKLKDVKDINGFIRLLIDSGKKDVLESLWKKQKNILAKMTKNTKDNGQNFAKTVKGVSTFDEGDKQDNPISVDDIGIKSLAVRSPTVNRGKGGDLPGSRAQSAMIRAPDRQMAPGHVTLPLGRPAKVSEGKRKRGTAIETFNDPETDETAKPPPRRPSKSVRPKRPKSPKK